jgi:hypothetical protein
MALNCYCFETELLITSALVCFLENLYNKNMFLITAKPQNILKPINILLFQVLPVPGDAATTDSLLLFPQEITQHA